MKTTRTILLGLFILVLSACAPQVETQPEPTVMTPAPVAEAPAPAALVPASLSFESLLVLDSGWTDWFGAGMVGHDDIMMQNGSGSIRLMTPAGADAAAMIIPSPRLDLRGRSFRIFVRSDNWADVSDASLVFYTSEDYNSFSIANLMDFLAPVNDEWLEVTLDYDSFEHIGGGNWENMLNILVRASSREGTQPSVWFANLGVSQ